MIRQILLFLTAASVFVPCRRYSQFHDLDSALRDHYKNVKLPKFPIKHVLRSKTDPSLVLERQSALQKWITAVLKEPVLAQSAILLNWIQVIKKR